jgi:hypothetical protein
MGQSPCELLAEMSVQDERQENCEHFCNGIHLSPGIGVRQG